MIVMCAPSYLSLILSDLLFKRWHKQLPLGLSPLHVLHLYLLHSTHPPPPRCVGVALMYMFVLQVFHPAPLFPGRRIPMTRMMTGVLCVGMAVTLSAATTVLRWGRGTVYSFLWHYFSRIHISASPTLQDFRAFLKRESCIHCHQS